MFTERQGLIIWFHSTRHLKVLRKFGTVHYVSRKMKYVVLYCDKEEAQRSVEEIKKLSSIKKIELSHRAELKLPFATKKLQQGSYDTEMSQFSE